jgi:hypothetical protein
MKTHDLWAALSAQSFPYLHELIPADRDGFVLLDVYLRDYLEEWCVSGGQLSVQSIALLKDCTWAITRRFRLLDGEGSGWAIQETGQAGLARRRYGAGI